MPVWSNETAEYAASIAARVAGIDAPGSPAWMVVRIDAAETLTPISRATSARRSAYVGVHSSTVAPRSSMFRTRCSLVIAPPEMHSAPRRSAPPNADQNPMNGPKEKAKKTRSAAVTPAAPYTCSAQIRVHHSHESAVSSQRKGWSPDEPDV